MPLAAAGRRVHIVYGRYSSARETMMSGTTTPKKPKRNGPNGTSKADRNGPAAGTAQGAVTIGEYLIERLGALGVEHVFGHPGRLHPHPLQADRRKPDQAGRYDAGRQCGLCG